MVHQNATELINTSPNPSSKEDGCKRLSLELKRIITRSHAGLYILLHNVTFFKKVYVTFKVIPDLISKTNDNFIY
jgi:hypothetical protein